VGGHGYGRRQLRIVSQQQLVKLIHLAPEIRSNAFLGSRQFPNTHNRGVIGFETPKTMLIRAQGIGQHVCVSTVVLGAGNGVTIAEAIQLFRVDTENRPAMFEKRFDQWSTWDFNRYGNGVDLAGRDSIRVISPVMPLPLCSSFRCSSTSPWAFNTHA
jgi:hypothetical protein